MRGKVPPFASLAELRQRGWSCQRPVGRALERDEDKIRRWKQQRWPEIKKKPNKSGERSSHRRKRTERAPPPMPHRAPRGQTPVLQYHFNWKMLSAMAG